jgi:hypothetical protein
MSANMPNSTVDAAGPSEGAKKDGTEVKPPPKPKTPAKFTFHAIKLFDAIAVCSALFIIVIARFLRPGFWSTLMYAMAGLPAGVAMSFLYFKRKREKIHRRELVRLALLISSERHDGTC